MQTLRKFILPRTFQNHRLFYKSYTSATAQSSESMPSSLKLASIPVMPRNPVWITESASKRLSEILEDESSLRIEVEAGGCHGYQVKMNLTKEYGEDDVLLQTSNGARVVIDNVSLDLIKGSKLDYIQELIGSTFKVVDIPNAQSGCGCGSSFNIKVE